MRKKYLAIGLSSLLLLSGCGGEEKREQNVLSARAGISALYRIKANITDTIARKPSVTLGMYVSMYLAQGTFIPVSSARDGIETQLKLLAGQSSPTNAETFALLQEFGSLLQVDIVDTLNRSTNRRIALDQYVDSLQGMGAVALRKFKELEVQQETLNEERKEQRTAVREIENVLKDSLRSQDYSLSANKQEELAPAQSALAETEAKIKQTKTIINIYEELLDIARERLLAIESNREVLIAGLRVVEMPGVEELDILDGGRVRRRRSGKTTADEDPFGTQYTEGINPRSLLGE